MCVCLERIKRIAGKYYKKMKEGKRKSKNTRGRQTVRRERQPGEEDSQKRKIVRR